jgi:hypothetical protein
VSQLARSLARTHAQQWAAVQRKRALERHSRRSRFSSIKGSAAPAPSPAGARLADVHARNLTPTTTTIHRLTTPAHLFVLVLVPVQCPSRAPRPPHPHVYPGRPKRIGSVGPDGLRATMAVARLVSAPFPLAPLRVRAPRPALPPGAHAGPRPPVLALAPPAASAAPRRAVPARAAPEDGGRGDAAAAAARAARKQSERRTYLVAAVMSSLGITSMAAAAVYYRFAWQMEVRYVVARNEGRRVASRRSVCVHSRSWVDSVRCLARAAARSR